MDPWRRRSTILLGRRSNPTVADERVHQTAIHLGDMMRRGIRCHGSVWAPAFDIHDGVRDYSTNNTTPREHNRTFFPSGALSATTARRQYVPQLATSRRSALGHIQQPEALQFGCQPLAQDCVRECAPRDKNDEA
jgi:hypothetical protein